MRAQKQLEREKRQAAADALVRRVDGTVICVMGIVFVVVQLTLLLFGMPPPNENLTCPPAPIA